MHIIPDTLSFAFQQKDESENNLSESLSKSQYKLEECSTELESCRKHNRQLEQTLVKVTHDSTDKDEVIEVLQNNLEIIQVFTTSEQSRID